MNLNDLKVKEKAIVAFVDTISYKDTEIDFMDGLHRVMRLGVVPGVEIEKLSSVATCSEYLMEGSRIIIDKCLADYIIVVRN